jgi:PadR family transcriptional regulator PadR
MGKDRIDVLLGTLEMLILQILSRAPQLHGYDIIERLGERSAGALKVEEGALYPALHRLELKGWLAGEWRLSANNRRAKYYRLTARGRRQLEQQKVEWQRVVGVMARVLELG